MHLGSRRASTRAVAALSAASWLIFPGFGLIDLSVTWSSAWEEVLEAGWGLLSAMVIAVPFALVVWRPACARRVVLQLTVTDLALAVATAAGKETRLLLLVALLALQTALLFTLGGPPGEAVRPSRVLLALVALGIAPWLMYALHMWSLNRAGMPADVSVGIDHYAVQGAFALAVAVLPAVSHIAARCAGVSAAYLGIVSLAWPHASAGPTGFWSGAAIVWGLAVVAATTRSLDRSG